MLESIANNSLLQIRLFQITIRLFAYEPDISVLVWEFIKSVKVV